MGAWHYIHHDDIQYLNVFLIERMQVISVY